MQANNPFNYKIEHSFLKSLKMATLLLNVCNPFKTNNPSTLLNFSKPLKGDHPFKLKNRTLKLKFVTSEEFKYGKPFNQCF